MSIHLSFSNPIISFKIFNSEHKSKSSRSNKLSCFKYFLFKYNSFFFIFINLSIIPFCDSAKSSTLIYFF